MNRVIALGFTALLTGLIAGVLPSTSTQANSAAGLHFTTIQMSSAKNGWGEIETGNGDWKILHTTDGGVNWQDTAIIPMTCDVVIGNGAKAWYVQKSVHNNIQYATVYRAMSGGITWTASNTFPLPVGYSDRLQLTFTPSGRVGWLAITTGGNASQTLQLWRTVDSGDQWKLISNENPFDFLLGFRNAQDGWAECVHGGAPFADWLKRPDPNGEPVLYHTTDGGRTWKPQYLPVPDTLSQYNGHVSLGNTIWFGDEGFIPVSFTSDHPDMKWGVYVTKDGGDIWHFYMENAVANNYGSNLTQVNFSIVSPTDLFESVTALHETNNGPYLAKSTYMYFKSIPDHRWMQVSKTPVPFIQVQFVSKKVGFAITQAGVLYKTLNGGHDWRTIG